MIKLKVIALGKLKEKYLKDAADEYIKRLSGYAKTEIVEIEPVRLSDNPSKTEIEKALDTEAELILKKIPEGSLTAALCIEGKQYSSEEFHEVLDSYISKGTSSVVFIIGSSYGLSDKIKKVADIKLSFSKMTFPHQLFRVMLLEQIYRNFKIGDGSKYHK